MRAMGRGAWAERGAWLWAPGRTEGGKGTALEASASERFPKKATGVES